MSTSSTWLADATTVAEQVEQALGSTVIDLTPAGEVARQKLATQIRRDITRQTSVKIVQGLIRGVLADRPKYRRVGVIGHRTHVKAMEDLGEPFASRIARASYFGSGDERSSNQWYRRCDLVIIAGTPRINPQSLRDYLVRIGEFGAAGEEPKWGEIRWRGQSVDGATRIVKGRGYEHPIWRKAYEALVRAAMVQSIGRGRGLLEDGADVLVLSSDPCGMLLDRQESIEPVNDTDVRIIAVVNDPVSKTEELTQGNDIIYNIISKAGVSTVEVSKRLSVSPAAIRDRAARLAERGLITRVSDRGGWAPVLDNAATAVAEPSTSTGNTDASDAILGDSGDGPASTPATQTRSSSTSSSLTPSTSPSTAPPSRAIPLTVRENPQAVARAT